MVITVCVIGTRGDVQPAVALGRALQEAGHEVRLFTHEVFAPLVREHGLEIVGFPGDPRDVQVGSAIVEIGANPVRLTRFVRGVFRPVLGDLFERTLAAAEGSDLILASSLAITAFHVAERLRIPAISIQLQPSTITREFPGAFVPPLPRWMPLQGLYNRAGTKLYNQIWFQVLRDLANECRRTVLDLPPLGFGYWWNVDSPRGEIPMIFGWSPAVLPQPADWGPYKQVAGYWFLDRLDTYQPPDDLVSFLSAGSPPVFIGFGSIVDHDPRNTALLAIEAVRRSGQRAILQRGWGGLEPGDLPESMIAVGDVPHDWLFPRVAAAVHHGGAGTTAAALRAGVPAVVVPYLADQFFWGWRVHELGAGPRCIRRKRLTVDRLAAAIERAAGDDDIRRRAQDLGSRIRAEDGTGRGVALIERFAGAAA